MKIRFNLLIISAILLIVILLVTASSTFVPYSEDTIFSKQFKYEGMSSIADTASKFEVNSELLKKKKCAEKDGKEKVEGFKGLQSSPLSDFVPIDVLGHLKSSTKCTSIYSSSTGMVCLDDKTKKLLETRGGNSLSGESEIGK
jgi:hypothetical protein